MSKRYRLSLSKTRKTVRSNHETRQTTWVTIASKERFDDVWYHRPATVDGRKSRWTTRRTNYETEMRTRFPTDAVAKITANTRRTKKKYVRQVFKGRTEPVPVSDRCGDNRNGSMEQGWSSIIFYFRGWLKIPKLFYMENRRYFLTDFTDLKKRVSMLGCGYFFFQYFSSHS